MGKNILNNPLAIPQRENAGANTFAKYDYQYHWALCRVLREHETTNQYLVFVELHEDVVLATSDKAELANFEFNQIKNYSTSPWKINKLISRKKPKNSILGKLMLGVNEKPFYDKLKSLNLVATCGYELEQKEPTLKLKLIRKEDLTDLSITKFKEALKDEIGSENFPDFLQFVTPDLSATGFKESSIGLISELIEKNFPGCHSNPIYIYRSLIDELYKKGQVSFDFTKWDEVVKEKALSRAQVEKVIHENSSIKDENKIHEYFTKICEELGLKYHQKIKLERAFDRYLNSKFNRTSLQLEISEALKESINKHYEIFENSGVVEFIKGIRDSEDNLLKNYLSGEDEINSAIIYELIIRNLYES